MKNLLSFLINRGTSKRYIVRPFPFGGNLSFHTPFISQSVPDIRHRLQKWEDGPQTPQQDVFTLTFKVFNNQHKEAESQHLKRDQAKYKMQATAIQGPPKYQLSPLDNGSKALQAHAAGVIREATGNLSGEGHTPPCRETGILGPQQAKPPWQDHRRLRVPWKPLHPGPKTTTRVKHQVTLLVVGKLVSFLINTGATYSAQPQLTGHKQPSQVSIVHVGGLISKPLPKPLPNCTPSGTPFSCSFLILTKCPAPTLGRDILSNFRASLRLLTPVSLSEPSLLPLAHLEHDKLPLLASVLLPWVWDTSTHSIAQQLAPVQTELKDQSANLCQPQYRPLTEVTNGIVGITRVHVPFPCLTCTLN